MIPKNSTPVPNIIFDAYLPILKPTELALLMIIIRQTIGWIDKKSRKRKYRDWITGSQLREKTGYSRKSLSIAIETLIQQQLIKVFDYKGDELKSPQERMGKTCLYYAFNFDSLYKINPTVSSTCVKSTQYLRTFYAQQKKLLQKKMTLA